MWFLMWLFTSIANASPTGTVAIGGITLGAPLPSGFQHLVDSNGIPTKNGWYKMSAIGGIHGRLEVQVCNGVVHQVHFGALPESSSEAHMVWADALSTAGFTSPVPYNHCTTKEGYLCQTWWTNSKNRKVLMMWFDDGTPSLSEFLDKTCTEGI